jgi:hypothetical protein
MTRQVVRWASLSLVSKHQYSGGTAAVIVVHKAFTRKYKEKACSRSSRTFKIDLFEGNLSGCNLAGSDTGLNAALLDPVVKQVNYTVATFIHRLYLPESVTRCVCLGTYLRRVEYLALRFSENTKHLFFLALSSQKEGGTSCHFSR